MKWNEALPAASSSEAYWHFYVTFLFVSQNKCESYQPTPPFPENQPKITNPLALGVQLLILWLYLCVVALGRVTTRPAPLRLRVSARAQGNHRHRRPGELSKEVTWKALSRRVQYPQQHQDLLQSFTGLIQAQHIRSTKHAKPWGSAKTLHTCMSVFL